MDTVCPLSFFLSIFFFCLHRIVHLSVCTFSLFLNYFSQSQQKSCIDLHTPVVLVQKTRDRHVVKSST
jgi:hypothetical protein